MRQGGGLFKVDCSAEEKGFDRDCDCLGVLWVPRLLRSKPQTALLSGRDDKGRDGLTL